MDNAIIVNKTAHGTDVGLLFEVDTNNVHGFGVALGLCIVALACVLAKCLFLYYIQVHAPKERPLNRLMALEQVKRNHNKHFAIYLFISTFSWCRYSLWCCKYPHLP